MTGFIVSILEGQQWGKEAMGDTLGKTLRFFFVHLWATWTSAPERHPERCPLPRNVWVEEGVHWPLGEFEENDLSSKRWTFSFPMGSSQGEEPREGKLPLPPLFLEALGPGPSICPTKEKAGAEAQGWASTWSRLGWAGLGPHPACSSSPWQSFPSRGSRPHQLILGWGFPKSSV